MRSLREIREETRPSKILLHLKDDAIVKISEDSFSHRGCDTCDYGSSYGVSYTLLFEKGQPFFFDIESMYDSPISEGELMQFFTNNIELIASMTHDELCVFLKCKDHVLGRG